MHEHIQTSWELIQGASIGEEEATAEFAQLYSPLIRSYLFARWRSSGLVREVDDATQEVFLRCFKEGGVLGRAEQGAPGGFRAFLYGVVRNVALKVEGRAIRPTRVPAPSTLELEEIAESEASLAKTFDRAWARSIMKKAVSLQAQHARATGDEALRRVEILRLRFQEGMPIRDIARQWEADADRLHREYARARKEFEAALMDVLAGESSANRKELEQQMADLLLLLR
jgi:RNA polymerase sigma factor (sigma-70 family)